MAFEVVKFYRFLCDKCGARSTDGTPVVAWPDQDEAEEDAVCRGWGTNLATGRATCPDCDEGGVTDGD